LLGPVFHLPKNGQGPATTPAPAEALGVVPAATAPAARPGN